MHFNILLTTFTLFSSSVSALPSLQRAPPRTSLPGKSDDKKSPAGDDSGSAGLAVGTATAVTSLDERRWERYLGLRPPPGPKPPRSSPGTPRQQPNQAEATTLDGQRLVDVKDKSRYSKSDGTRVWLGAEEERRMAACLRLMEYRVARRDEIWDQCIEYGINDQMTTSDLDYGPTEAGKKLKTEGELLEWEPQETTSDGDHHDPSINEMVVDKVRTLRQNVQNIGLKMSGAIGAVERNNKKGGVVGAPGGGGLLHTVPRLQMTPSL
ncbi:MAG: hypothetical protein M1816_001087 [Peltula sp. TS41687]|nr:MAG: hypothetical protein M1816_001087 [Peltula sp. TS41687]